MISLSKSDCNACMGQVGWFSILPPSLLLANKKWSQDLNPRSHTLDLSYKFIWKEILR